MARDVGCLEGFPATQALQFQLRTMVRRPALEALRMPLLDDYEAVDDTAAVTMAAHPM